MKVWLIFAILLSLLGNPCRAASSTDAPGWAVLFLHGGTKNRCTIVHDKILFDNGVYKYMLSAPNYDRLRIVSDDSQMYYDSTLKDFKQTWDSGGLGFAYKWQIKQIKQVGSDVIAGLPCDHYHAVAVNSPGSYADFWIGKTLIVEPKLAASCCYLCDIPSGYGMPVRMTVVNPHEGVTMSVLDALKARQVKPVDPHVFVVPPSYGKAKNLIDVMTGSKDGTINFEDFFFANPPDKQKPKTK
jgi:hypothetical protein